MWFPLTASLLIGLLSSALALHAAEPKSLFNGKDLNGWDGNPHYWSVRDGVICGETTFKTLPLDNTFLIWRGGAPKDFELRVKFRIQSGNSGIQYRSRDLGKWIISGYQAEIENKQGKSGLLYEEKGRKFLANVGESAELNPNGDRIVLGQLASKESLIKKGYYKERDWNEYLIIAKGNHLEQWLNGIKVIEFTDNDSKHRLLEGLIALQIHAGPPMRVEFKDIFLKTL